MENSFHFQRATELEELVQLFWESDRSNTHFNKETIIPKGTIEIIFNFSPNEAITANFGTRTFQIPKCFLSGYHTVPIQLQLPERQFFFGVVFNSTILRNIFKIKADDFANHCIDMTLVDPSLNSLWHQLADQKTFQERVSVFSDWLKKRVPVTSRQDQLFDQFLNTRTNEFTSVSELSKWLCYSPRQLSRKLQELTGMNSEQTLLYKKYLQAIHLMHYSELPLTEIAYACQFADQSHFIKTFKSFAQIRPNEYRTMKSRVSGHILENVR